MKIVQENPEKRTEPERPLSSQIDDVLNNIRVIKEHIQEGKRHDYAIGDYYHKGYIKNVYDALNLCETLCKNIYKAQLESEVCSDVAKKLAPDKIIVIERGNN